MSTGAFGIGDDPLNAGAVAYAASTQTDDPSVTVLYLALARMAVTEARAKLERLEFMVDAREKELVRAAKVKRELGG